MRAATANDIIEFYGEPQPYTMRANVVTLDGKAVGLVGVVRHPEWGTFFSDFKPALQPYLSSVTVWRAIVGAMTFVKAYKGPVLSIADGPEGCLNLCKLGFKHLHGAWWGWLG